MHLEIIDGLPGSGEHLLETVSLSFQDTVDLGLGSKSNLHAYSLFLCHRVS